MSLVHNERTKLMATFFNTLASGSIITGVVAPAAAFVFRVQGVGELSLPFLAGSAAIWLSVGVALHLLARRLLGRLVP